MNGLREPDTEPIPGYRLIEPLGSGGFGEVWKCEAPGGLQKAIKFVYGNLNSLDVDSVRAEQEKNALQRVKEVRHPFICSLERIEEVEGELVIVMELADRSLHDLYEECKGSGRIGIPRDDLLRYLRDAAEALDYMNEKYKLQHLDVKPRNLFLISERVKVADFGLVKHLERQSASGLLGGVTPLYAPPETFNGKFSDRSDQYSLAIVYQELLTGQRPFTGKNVRQLAQAHLQGTPELRPLPEGERPMVARALSKDPTKRFPNCMAFIRALYGVRQPVRRENTPAAEAALAKQGARPTTMHETMEDILLEGPRDPSEEVHLTGPPLQRNCILDDDDNEVEVSESELGRTVAQPSTGALRPTLIIGVGSFGRKAVLELRCRFVDRFGDLSKLPLLRFLCIDPDPEAVNLAVRGAPEVALTKNEIYPLPLQPVGNYRKRMVDQLSDWLPREKLYSMPRSLQTQGSRALGRLAYVDHQQRLMARLRREIQEITNPDTIYQTVTQTGLALRDSTPRVYVIGSGYGGSSGLLPDLGYAIRRMLQQMRHPDANTTLMLMCGAPNDPATPKAEMANVYATLTEINHFSDPAIPFSAQYGVDGQRIVDQGTPFTATYLLPLAHRSPDALDETVSHLGSYLFHELTTPLGLRLDQLRHQGNDKDDSPPVFGGLLTPFRSMGTYAVWFPRGLLLRLASRMACRRLIEGWLDSTDLKLNAPVMSSVQSVCEAVSADPTLHPDALAKRIEEVCGGAPLNELGATPAEALAGLLASVEDQSLQNVAYDDPGNWARQAVTRIREWVGLGGDAAKENHDWRKTKLNRALTAAATKVADEWNQKLTGAILQLMEMPGARMAAAEAGLGLMQQAATAAAQARKVVYEQQCARTTEAWNKLEESLNDCLQGAGGFRFFGGRSPRRLLANFVASLTNYSRQRLQEEVLFAVRHFFIALNGKLGERLRDMGFCRQRLRHLHEELTSPFSDSEADMASTKNGELTASKSPLPSAESFWESIRQSQTARVVLPEGEIELERASLRFLQRLTPEHWMNLDKELHDRVLVPRGGLHGACVNGNDMTKTLAAPLMDETITQLGQHLPVMDVAEILMGEFARIGKGTMSQEDLEPQLRDYLQRAAPLFPRLTPEADQRLLLLPASESGKNLGELAQKTTLDLKTVRVPGQSELMFCREIGWLTVQDIHKVLQTCRNAFENLATTPQTSPHARFDITDWLPLDP